MANYLITGVAGSGKSTIGRELHRRGYRVIDTDRTWGRQIQLPTAKRGLKLDPCAEPPPEHPAHGRGEAWVWDILKARRALAQKSSVRFFFGGADNEFQLYELFDKIFVLNTDAECIIHRLKQRGDHPTSLSDFISKTYIEIRFRSKYLATPNLVSISTLDEKPRNTADIIVSHIYESHPERIIRTVRIITGLPYFSTILYRGIRTWKILKGVRQDPQAPYQTQ